MAPSIDYNRRKDRSLQEQDVQEEDWTIDSRLGACQNLKNIIKAPVRFGREKGNESLQEI